MTITHLNISNEADTVSSKSYKMEITNTKYYFSKAVHFNIKMATKTKILKITLRISIVN